MSAITVEQNLFDLAFLESLDDKDFVDEAITLYIHDTYDNLRQMQMEYEAGHINIIYQIAHKLKSSTGMLQATILSGILAQVEAMAQEGNTDNKLADLVQAAQYEFGKLKTALLLHLRAVA